jgi:hypothetical protein
MTRLFGTPLTTPDNRNASGALSIQAAGLLQLKFARSRGHLAQRIVLRNPSEKQINWRPAVDLAISAGGCPSYGVLSSLQLPDLYKPLRSLNKSGPPLSPWQAPPCSSGTEVVRLEELGLGGGDGLRN